MEKFLCFTILVTGVLCYGNDGLDDFRPNDKNSVVGGAPITIFQAPYQAQILYDGETICGATLISNQFLVTAAHCLNLPKKSYKVIVGSHYPQVGKQQDIEFIKSHEHYKKRTFENDIGIIKLKHPIEINPAQKPIKFLHRDPKAGEYVKISGFGHEKTGAYTISKQLKAAVVPVIDSTLCQLGYNHEVGNVEVMDVMFCAGAGETDTCQGDSGGPAVIRGKLAGIVSFGLDCASSMTPGIYTRANQYIDWVLKHTGVQV
ncbi:hypothetical protein QAD02_023271 [Eretmocerus hayati]|uniref:Uncharacterized protein n=1 Tax=Eretmocerus hayati TaxID=131215 RepID=A0ACC2PYQ9_9HYME|nr:hypothetical protein QAD02_023271 [Eretmocerus hayati]